MFKNILDQTDLVPEIKVSALKSFLTGDGYAYDVTILLNGKGVCHVQHDGRGGEMMCDFVGNGETLVNKYIKDNKLNQIMFENGWDFLESVDKISNEDVLEAIIEDEITNQDTRKKINRYQAKGLVIGTKGSDSFSTISWKQPLKKLIEVGHKDKLKDAIAKKIAELKDGEFILNNNLEKLGLL